MDTMSVATIETETTTTTAKPAKPVTGTELDKAVAALHTRYVAADKGETAARKHFEDADIAWQNARVIKVRVAFAASMLTPNAGKANLLAASRFLLTTPDEFPTAGKRTAAAKSRKNTLRNYVAAGEALQEAGLAERITEPDANERKIVADVFREMNKRDKAEASDADKDADKAGKGEGEGEGEGDGDALTGVVDLVGHIARLQATFNLIKSTGLVISEQEAGKVSEMLAEFTARLAEYADGK
jgi:hypothetical protein